MSDADDQSVLKQIVEMNTFFKENVYTYLLSFTLCIQYIVQEDGKKPVSDYSSGFLTVIDEQIFLVMAGHVCKGIKEALESGLLREVNLIFVTGPKSTDSVPLDLGVQEFAFVYKPEDFDIGYTLLPDHILKLLISAKVHAISPERFQPPTESPSVRLLIGCSAAHCKEGEVTSFYVIEDGKEKTMKQMVYLGVAHRTVFAEGFKEKRNRQWIAYPLKEDEQCVRGMSGGFYVELFAGKTLDSFTVVGIQSEQRYKEKNGVRTVTQMFATDPVLVPNFIRKTYPRLTGDQQVESNE